MVAAIPAVEAATSAEVEVDFRELDGLAGDIRADHMLRQHLAADFRARGPVAIARVATRVAPGLVAFGRAADVLTLPVTMVRPFMVTAVITAITAGAPTMDGFIMAAFSAAFIIPG